MGQLVAVERERLVMGVNNGSWCTVSVGPPMGPLTGSPVGPRTRSRMGPLPPGGVLARLVRLRGLDWERYESAASVG